jgi:NADH dehydrogenase/NADH:ubiquinone oxidoreductase subunit G
MKMQIDNQEVTATDGMSVLDAAKQAGIHIPTLCHHEALEPFGGCRLCMVEVVERGKPRLVVSCVFPAADGLVVKTRSPEIDKIRKTLLELLLAHAPHSPQLTELAEEYGADPNRYDKQPSFCILCGLCVRYCNEVKQVDAIGFVERGVGKEISFIPEVAAEKCASCKECFPLCPTSFAQAAYVLLESQAFPR